MIEFIRNNQLDIMLFLSGVCTVLIPLTWVVISAQSPIFIYQNLKGKRDRLSLPADGPDQLAGGFLQQIFRPGGKREKIGTVTAGDPDTALYEAYF